MPAPLLSSTLPCTMRCTGPRVCPAIEPAASAVSESTSVAAIRRVSVITPSIRAQVKHLEDICLHRLPPSGVFFILFFADQILVVVPLDLDRSHLDRVDGEYL